MSWTANFPYVQVPGKTYCSSCGSSTSRWQWTTSRSLCATWKPHHRSSVQCQPNSATHFRHPLLSYPSTGTETKACIAVDHMISSSVLHGRNGIRWHLVEPHSSSRWSSSALESYWTPPCACSQATTTHLFRHIVQTKTSHLHLQQVCSWTSQSTPMYFCWCNIPRQVPQTNAYCCWRWLNMILWWSRVPHIYWGRLCSKTPMWTGTNLTRHSPF